MELARAQAGARPGETSAAPRGGRLAEIEVLRAIAVLMVMIHHTAGNLMFWPTYIDAHLLDNGGFWTGVDLFFAISGFVIARSLVPQLAAVRDWTGFTRVSIPFWIARAWRLLPSSWLWLVLPVVLCLVYNRSGVYGSFAENWAVFIAGVLDIQNFHFVQTFCHSGNGTAFVQWSLSLEEQFYFILPFAAFFFRRYLVIPLFIIASIGFFTPNTVLAMMLRLWPVALGVLLALWSRHETYQACAPTGLAKSRTARAGLLLLLLACLVSVGATWLTVVSFYQGVIALISVILVWIASYDRGYLWEAGWHREVMAAIAARSYCLYLVHIPVYFAAHETWYRLHGTTIPSRHQAVVLIAASFLAIFAIAELNHRLLERPLREHGKKLAAQYRAKMTRPAVAAE